MVVFIPTMPGLAEWTSKSTYEVLITWKFGDKARWVQVSTPSATFKSGHIDCMACSTKMMIWMSTGIMRFESALT